MNIMNAVNMKIFEVVALCLICSTAWGQVPSQGRRSYLTQDSQLLGESVQFHDLVLARPLSFMPLVDSLHTLMQTRINAVKTDSLEYEIGPVFQDSLGSMILASRITNCAPDPQFGCISRYIPVAERNGEPAYTIRGLMMDGIELREYRFIASGFIVRQVFIQSPSHIFKLDFLIKGVWTQAMIKTYESVVASLGFSAEG